MPREFRRHPWLAVEFYALDLARPPFDDPALRRALWAVTDRDALARDVLGGAAYPADRLVPPGIEWYDAVADVRLGASPGAAVDGQGGDGQGGDGQGGDGQGGEADAAESPGERAAAASAAFAAAGFGPGRPVSVTIRVNDAFHHQAVARAAAGMWAPLGFEVGLESAPAAAHFRHLREGGAFEVARAGWVADARDPQAILALFRCPPGAPETGTAGAAAADAATGDGATGDGATGDGAQPGSAGAWPGRGLNPAGYCNPEVNALLDRAAVRTRPEERARLLAEAEALILADLPVLPLYYHASLNLVSTAVSGWEDNLMDVHPSRFLSLRR
jgi:oligopeptide transport system substrate-binding protein